MILQSLATRLLRCTCVAVLLAGIAFVGAAVADTTLLPAHRAARPLVHSSLAAPKLVASAETALQRVYTGQPISVTTYHYDNNRTGWNPTETDLTPASVASAKFGLLTSLAVDGNVLAQPLLVSQFVMPSGETHDILIIATGHNTVYAYDAQTYAILWQVNLGTSQSSSDVYCGDVIPEYGISSTPVIVQTGNNAATLYVVAAIEPVQNTFFTVLHALNLGTGADIVPPQVISPSSTLAGGATIAFNPIFQWNRTGLAYHNGSLYIGIGSHCDNDEKSISGWLLRYNTNLELLNQFHTVRTPGGTELASIWMTGFAPAIDSQGNVFVVTGNGDYRTGQLDWGESALKLMPALSEVISSFTPSFYPNYNANDRDFGSGGIMLLPQIAGQAAPPLAVAMGKPSILYLLNQNNLGGVAPNDAGALQAHYDAGYGGLWGGPAYWNGPAGPTVFTQTDSDVLKAWSVNTSATPSLTLSATGTSPAGYGGSLPIVSSNGAKAGTGVVWLINRAEEPFSLEAYDASALGAPIFAAQIGMWSNPNQGNPFLTPMEANGRVYAPGYKVVQVFGLSP